MNILAFMHPGTNSRGLLEDIVHGVESLGHRVTRFELNSLWAIRAELGADYTRIAAHMGRLLLDVIESNRIDLSLGMWSNGARSLPIIVDQQGRAVTSFDHVGCPVLHYWWDAPHWFNNQSEYDDMARGLFRGSYQFHCINNPATGSEMAGLMGFANVIPSPNGVNPERFKPCPNVQREYDLMFISGGGDPPPTAVMLEELELDTPDMDRIRKDVAQSVRSALAGIVTEIPENLCDDARTLLDALIDIRLAERHQPALAHLQQVVQHDHSLAPAANALTANFRMYIRATDTIRRIEKWERPFMVAYLSRHFRCLRLGTQSYDAWGVQGDVHEHEFVPYDQQAQAYAKAHFALNVMRWQDDVGLNSKAFEIPACKCGLLQSYRAGIDDLYEDGREAIVFRTPAEARERLADLNRSPDDRDAMIHAGRERALAEHTWANRFQVILGLVTQATSQVSNSTASPGTTGVGEVREAASMPPEALATVQVR